MEKIGLRKNRKGLIFTIDAILAILATIMILISVYSILSNSHFNSENNDLNKIALDSLTVLEKNDYLDQSVSGNLTMINNFLAALPSNICGNISVYYQDKGIITSSKKPGCLISDNVVVTRRAFVFEHKTYFAKMEVSYG